MTCPIFAFAEVPVFLLAFLRRFFAIELNSLQLYLSMSDCSSTSSFLLRLSLCSFETRCSLYCCSSFTPSDEKQHWKHRRINRDPKFYEVRHVSSL